MEQVENIRSHCVASALSSALPPLCETDFLDSREFMPSAASLQILQNSRVVKDWKAYKRARFESWVCSLQGDSDAEVDLADLSQTIAKTMFFWIEGIFRSGKLRKRPILRPRTISTLQFVPHPDQFPHSLGNPPPKGCTSPTDWLRTDVCRVRHNQTVLGADFDQAMQSRGATTRALWISGLLMCKSLNAIGPCGQRSARYLMQNARWIVPKGTARAASSIESKQLTIGMHVRRGDACMRWARAGDGNTRKSRPCYHLSDYIDAARKMAATYGARRILVATDSDSVISELETFALTTDEFTIVYVPYERSALFAEETRNMNLSIAEAANRGGFIEQQSLDQEQKTLVFATFFAELKMLLQADMFIGTSASVVSRSMFLAQVGYHGHVPPSVLAFEAAAPPVTLLQLICIEQTMTHGLQQRRVSQLDLRNTTQLIIGNWNTAVVC
eukprot:6208739-Pleurochrysis_carterae.AAC.1